MTLLYFILFVVQNVLIEMLRDVIFNAKLTWLRWKAWCAKLWRHVGARLASERSLLCLQWHHCRFCFFLLSC